MSLFEVSKTALSGNARCYQLEALESRDADLDAALDDVSMGVSGLVEVVRNRGSDALSVVPEQVAKTQLAFMAVGSACEGVVR